MYGVLIWARVRFAGGKSVFLFLAMFAFGIFGGSAGRAEDNLQNAHSSVGRDAVQVGTASWYGEWHHGRQTANGESFDMYAMTAAHRSLPLGTHIRVTNLKNQKTVLLRVNDRGPYIHGRILDVSLRAAKKLGFVQSGLTPVRIMVVPPNPPIPIPPVRFLVAAYPKSKPAAPQRPLERDDWLVQIAAVWTQTDAEFEWRRLSRQHGNLLQHHTPRIQQDVRAGRDVFRVRIGAFEQRQSARDVCRSLLAQGQDCFVVTNGRAES